MIPITVRRFQPLALQHVRSFRSFDVDGRLCSGVYPASTVVASHPTLGDVFVDVFSVDGKGVEQKAAFEQTVQRWASLGEHPNVGKLLGVVEDEASKRWCIVYEHFEDTYESLDVWIRTRGATVSRASAVRIILCILRSLQYIHTQHIVKRNVDLHSIAMTVDDTPKWIRFDGAILYDFEDYNVKALKSFVPPELRTRYGGDGQAVPASDVYGVALVIGSILTSTCPPHRPAPSANRIKGWLLQDRFGLGAATELIKRAVLSETPDQRPTLYEFIVVFADEEKRSL